jgi:hypothetical protein
MATNHPRPKLTEMPGVGRGFVACYSPLAAAFGSPIPALLLRHLEFLSEGAAEGEPVLVTIAELCRAVGASRHMVQTGLCRLGDMVKMTPTHQGLAYVLDWTKIHEWCSANLTVVGQRAEFRRAEKCMRVIRNSAGGSYGIRPGGHTEFGAPVSLEEDIRIDEREIRREGAPTHDFLGNSAAAASLLQAMADLCGMSPRNPRHRAELEPLAVELLAETPPYTPAEVAYIPECHRFRTWTTKAMTPGQVGRFYAEVRTPNELRRRKRRWGATHRAKLAGGEALARLRKEKPHDSLGDVVYEAWRPTYEPEWLATPEGQAWQRSQAQGQGGPA